MKKATILISLIFLSAISSCKKEIKSKTGGIDMISNVYFNASSGLEEVQTYHVSRINYSNDSILELIPDVHLPSVNLESNFIVDTLFYPVGENPEHALINQLTKEKGTSVFSKKSGAIFTKEIIPNYEYRRILKDTVFFGKKYKRFEINSPALYTRFYFYQTDTILPYRLYEHAEKEFKGRLERIDSYNKKTDVFVTLQIIPRKNWDEEAKEFFSYNNYANKVSIKK